VGQGLRSPLEAGGNPPATTTSLPPSSARKTETTKYMRASEQLLPTGLMKCWNLFQVFCIEKKLPFSGRGAGTIFLLVGQAPALPSYSRSPFPSLIHFSLPFPSPSLISRPLPPSLPSTSLSYNPSPPVPLEVM